VDNHFVASVLRHVETFRNSGHLQKTIWNYILYFYIIFKKKSIIKEFSHSQNYISFWFGSTDEFQVWIIYFISNIVRSSNNSVCYVTRN
jgi:hypothetical protein